MARRTCCPAVLRPSPGGRTDGSLSWLQAAEPPPLFSRAPIGHSVKGSVCAAWCCGCQDKEVWHEMVDALSDRAPRPRDPGGGPTGAGIAHDPPTRRDPANCGL